MQSLSLIRKLKLAQAEYVDSCGNSTCPKTPQRRTFLEEAEAGPAESGVFCRSGVVQLYPITNSVVIKLVTAQFLSSKC
jgi:hypothetical protein